MTRIFRIHRWDTEQYAELHRFAPLRFDVMEDGSVHGYLGGGLDRDELMSIAQTENIDPEVSELLASLLDYNVDLAPDEDGECRQLSITLEFTGVPVFLFEG